MASSISDGIYKAIEGRNMGVYTQAVRCVLCSRVVAYLDTEKYFRGPVLCVNCQAERSGKTEALKDENKAKALSENADKGLSEQKGTNNDTPTNNDPDHHPDRLRPR